MAKKKKPGRAKLAPPLLKNGKPVSAPDQAAPQDASASGLTTEQVKSQIKMPPELTEAYQRVVLAGMKLMFGPGTSQAIASQFEQMEGTTGERIGKGIAGLLATLYRQSNGTMPPQVIVPAGVELVMHAADFVNKAGLAKVGDKDIGEAMSTMVSTVMQMFKLDPARLEQFADQQGGAGAPAASQMQAGGAA